MSPQAVESEKAASVGPAAANANQRQQYHHRAAKSRVRALQQAANLLLALQSPLGVAQRLRFTLLFERYLYAAYGGLQL